MAKSSRFAVVGAGIVGLTAAIELITHGHEVVIFDREAPGVGTSSAANGAITPYSDDTISPTVVSLAEQSLSLYPSHVERLRELSQSPISYDDKGVLQLFLDGDDHDHANEIFEKLTSNDAPVKWLSANEARELEPSITSHVSAAIHYISEARFDTTQLIDATTKSLIRLGCTFSYPTNVVRVSPSHAYVKIETTTGSGYFDGAVIATGGHLREIDGMPDVEIDAIRGEIIEAVGPPSLIDRCLYRGDSFITPRRDGRLLLGTTYVKHERGMDTNRATVSIGGALKTMQAGSLILPALDACEIRRVWKAWRPTTLDLMPIIGRYNAENIVIADGFGGLGFTLSLSVAKIIASLITQPSTAEDQSLSPYRFERE